MTKPNIYQAAKQVADAAHNGASDEAIMLACDAFADVYEVSTRFFYELANTFAGIQNDKLTSSNE